MKVYINVGIDKRVNGFGSTRGSASDVEITVEDKHEFLKNPFIYKLISGNLVKDTGYQQEQIEQKNEMENKPTEIQILHEENTDLKLALAEMAEKLEIEKINMMLAVAELAENINGGV
ncbi:hypothetical protein CW306_03345 [Bacillus sp. BA3]|uniref:hypothetical protein n=1 Tax=Bacillus sp. BA3 TaxID=2057910 RepID=UPI000C344A44|nr:hypothetical protein [Bacillus sp. BA3]PKF90554.1 hypothetical protein CW306_03345 [Bacillus sp. BA3]